MAPVALKPVPTPRAAFDAATGRLRIVVSSPVPDRDDEVVHPKTLRLDTYRKNPVVIWSHDQQQFPIATSAAVYLDGDDLVEEWQFADTDDGRTAEKLYRDGVLKGASIGFKPDGKRRIGSDEAFRRYGVRRQLVEYTGGELVETSAVTVPSNPNALAVGWVDRPAALRIAKSGTLRGSPVSDLVRKSLRRLAGQAHGRATLRPVPRRTPVSATATKEMGTLDDTAGGATVDAPAPAPADDAGGSHTDAITENNRASAHALVDALLDGEIDQPTFLKKVKTLIRAHDDMTGDAGTGETESETESDDEPDEGAELAEMGDDAGEYDDDLEDKACDDDEMEEKAVGDGSGNQAGQAAAMWGKDYDDDFETYKERHGKKAAKNLVTKAYAAAIVAEVERLAARVAEQDAAILSLTNIVEKLA